jgi:hypothetical protein
VIEQRSRKGHWIHFLAATLARRPSRDDRRRVWQSSPVQARRSRGKTRTATCPGNSPFRSGRPPDSVPAVAKSPGPDDAPDLPRSRRRETALSARRVTATGSYSSDAALGWCPAHSLYQPAPKCHPLYRSRAAADASDGTSDNYLPVVRSVAGYFGLVLATGRHHVTPCVSRCVAPLRSERANTPSGPISADLAGRRGGDHTVTRGPVWAAQPNPGPINEGTKRRPFRPRGGHLSIRWLAFRRRPSNSSGNARRRRSAHASPPTVRRRPMSRSLSFRLLRDQLDA